MRKDRLVGILLLLISFLSISKAWVYSESDIETSQYGKNSLLQQTWALDSLKEYPFKGNECILDVGCGDGQISAKLTEYVPLGCVVGIDQSEKMLSEAYKNYPHNKISNLLFLRGNALSLPFFQQFDLVVSFCCLNWIEDQKAVLKEIKESLVPGGKMLLVMPAKYSYNLSTVSEALSQTDKWKSYFTKPVSIRYYYSPEEYREFLNKTGLKVISIDSTMVQDRFDSKEAFIRWIWTISSFARQLPQEKQLEFVEEVADRMLTECAPSGTDEEILLRSPKLEVWAEKI